MAGSMEWPDGFIPQNYGEEKMAQSMSDKQIIKAVKDKKELKKSDLSAYRRKYCGMGSGK